MTEELKEQIHERVYNIKVPTLGFSRRDLFNIAMEYAEPREKRIAELEQQIEKMKCLLNEIYSEYGFSELVKIRNNLPIEIQEVIKEIKEK